MAKSIIGRIDVFDSHTETWDSYSERLEQYFLCNEVKPEKKVPALLSLVGGNTYQLLRGLTAPKKPSECTYEELIKTLSDHLNPKPVVISERFRFCKRDQREGESIRDYIAELRKLSEHCDFKQLLNESIRDRLVCGLRSESIQNKLLAEKDLTLEQAIQISQAMETASRDATELQAKHVGLAVNKVNVRPGLSRQRGSGTQGGSHNVNRQRGVKCFRCKGSGHHPNDCYFKNEQCYKCKKVGHCKKACRSKGVHNLEAEEESDSSYEHDSLVATLEVQVNSVGNMCKKVDAIILEPVIYDKKIRMELDTGAAVSVMSERKFQEYFPDKIDCLKKTPIRLRTYSGELLRPIGVARVPVKYTDQNAELNLYIIPKEGPSLFGREWLSHLTLDWPSIKSMSVNTATSKVSETCSTEAKRKLGEILGNHELIFKNDMGTVKGIKASLRLKEGANPKFCKARPVPYALKQKVEEELVKLVDNGVITKVEYSEWATPIVPVIKSDGSVRICGDFKVTVNPIFEIDQYPLPRIEDIFAALSGGQRFTKLDLRHAYLQMTVDDKSRELLTINTHKGLYRYNRLLFGVASAPAIWQRTIDTVLQGLSGVKCVMDDMIITGATEEEHLQNLEAVLQRLHDYDLRVNLGKCEFFKERVSYCGHEIDRHGLHKTQAKIDAIINAPKPANVSELRSFLGIVNYYARFLPNLSSTLYPLHQLLSKGRIWAWTPQCDKSFSDIKHMITSDEVLTHYDPERQVRLACDASPYGIGCVLSHVMDDGSERPIAYASRSLLPAERNYSQIDREALGIVWGVKRFHTYLYGRHFTLLTDHKPLVSIFLPAKGISVTSAARMQRYALFLSGYDYEIMYKSTKKHGNADSLSRLPLKECESEEDTSVDMMYMSQFENLPVTSARIRQGTSHDKVLSHVIESVMRGWKSSVKQENKDLYPYFSRKDELTVQQGCLVWGMRVIIPPKLRNHVLNDLHVGHIGIAKMKALARSFVWWPGIDQDIENISRSCTGCQEYKRAPPSAPIHPWEWPTNPWERVHIDFAGPFMHSMFFIAVDAHSKWPEVIQMRETTSSHTIDVLRCIFSRNGVPKVLVSDNGPQFTSMDFQKFVKANGIKHVTSAPYHPSSNGLAERFVQSFKSAMKASKKESGFIQTKLSNFLLAYRNATHATTGESPAKLFLGRTLSSRLDLLKPNTEQNVKNKQFEMSSRRESALRVFTPGSKVIVSDYRQNTSSNWMPGTISEQTGPVSYRVQVDPNQTWRRHIDQIQESATNISAANTQNSNCVIYDNQSDSHSTQKSQADSTSHDVRTSSPEVRPSSQNIVTSSPGIIHTPLPIQETEPQTQPKRNPRRKAGLPDRFKDFVTYK